MLPLQRKLMNNRKIHNDYNDYSDLLDSVIQNFDFKGKAFANQDRNQLKLFDINDKTIVVKSFKSPNLINKIVYKFFRKSKAQRSFEYASKLLSLGIKTPQPIAYFEFSSLFLFKKSYYVSELLNYDFTIRSLVDDDNFNNFNDILRAFTRFTFSLHEKNINFLDHSPGNTLIKKNGKGYDFYLVDLNRMTFETMNFDARMKNFARLSPKDKMLKVMSEEYSNLIKGKTKEEVEKRMFFFSQQFSEKFKKWERFKKTYFFWRKFN